MTKVQCLRALHYFLLTSALQVYSGKTQVCPPPPLSWSDRASMAMSDSTSAIDTVRQSILLHYVPSASKAELSQRLMSVCLMATNLACSAYNCFETPLLRRISRGLSLTVTPSATEDCWGPETPILSPPRSHASPDDSGLMEDALASGAIPMVPAILGVTSLQAHQQFIQMLFKTVLDITLHFVVRKYTKR